MVDSKKLILKPLSIVLLPTASGSRRQHATESSANLQLKPLEGLSQHHGARALHEPVTAKNWRDEVPRKPSRCGPGPS